MESIGERLKQGREAKKLSLDDVQEATKIRKQYLAAIEAGRFEELPGEVYVKGFIRNYADFIGLDGAKMVADYNSLKKGASGERPPALRDRATLERKGRGDFKKKARREWLFVTLLFIVALGIAGFMLWGRNRPTSSVNMEPQGVPAGPSSLEAEQVTPPGAPEPEAAPQAGSPEVAAPQTADQPQAAAGTQPQTAAAVQPQAAATQFPPAKPVKAVVVRVNVLQRCWVRVIADGQVVAEGALPAGRQEEWAADKDMIIRFGNAGGVEVEYNGERLGRPGDPGEVVELKFPPAGGFPQARPGQAE
ncbi:MAG TPA: helix-turn-helix domain-containing protein [Firmicutes bacterium]|nr:helix-turn-helix domain-containing protein [Bacillota bacterium]